MSHQPQHMSLALQRRAVFSLPDAHGVDIECTRGSLWITLDHQVRDIVLAPGQHFRSDSHRPALVEAIEASCVKFSGADLSLALASAPERPQRSRSPWRLQFPSRQPALA